MVDGETVNLTDREAVLGVIFAGGASRRYGSDKAMAILGDRPLLQWVTDRVRPQVGKLAISGPVRDGFLLPSIPDAVKNAGPLSALCSALAWAEREGVPFVVTFSCDAPFVPFNIVGSMQLALADHDCVVACQAELLHPTCAFWRTSIRGEVETAFSAGVRSLHGAVIRVNSTSMDFSGEREGPCGDPFFNINSPGDMLVAKAWLEERRRAS
jgi:molybdopterin-guanine dinucleotide biosynthesis protein A